MFIHNGIMYESGGLFQKSSILTRSFSDILSQPVK